MPPKKKEEKETVVYPASKRKAAPFKPLRPSKAARTDSADSEKSSTSEHRPATGATSRTITINDDDNDADLNKEDDLLSDSDTSDGLPSPKPVAKATPSGFTTAKATHASASTSRPSTTRPAPPKQKPSRMPSPLTDSEPDLPPPTAHAAPLPRAPAPPIPSQTDEIPTIPRALLVRLLHEHFADKSTQIDTHALRVLQKYMEVFIRESIARARQGKGEAVDAGKAGEEDRGWLDLEDLERVAPGMMVDF